MSPQPAPRARHTSPVSPRATAPLSVPKYFPWSAPARSCVRSARGARCKPTSTARAAGGWWVACGALAKGQAKERTSEPHATHTRPILLLPPHATLALVERTCARQSPRPTATASPGRSARPVSPPPRRPNPRRSPGHTASPAAEIPPRARHPCPRSSRTRGSSVGRRTPSSRRLRVSPW